MRPAKTPMRASRRLSETTSPVNIPATFEAYCSGRPCASNCSMACEASDMVYGQCALMREVVFDGDGIDCGGKYWCDELRRRRELSRLYIFSS